MAEMTEFRPARLGERGTFEYRIERARAYVLNRNITHRLELKLVIERFNRARASVIDYHVNNEVAEYKGHQCDLDKGYGAND